MKIDQIASAYPDEWVLIGNPKFDGLKVLEGDVLYHSKDKREIAAKGAGWRSTHQQATTIFTGRLEPKRYWL